MPTLEWIGKEKVINHDKEVPFKLLEARYTFDANGKREGTADSDNMIIHGDNLLALKALLPKYQGKIKCIYIDPPYNTGNEGWVYNDKVSDPQIKKWLGEVVGKEGEDLSRHDKWLCMMYPRLKLLQQLLAEDGAIFISIDDNELSNLKLICNEIFGERLYQGCIVRSTGQTTGQDSKGLGSSFDFVLIYSKSEEYTFGGLPLTEHDLKRFQEKDEKGFYAYDQLRKTGSNDRRTDRPNMYYPIKNPDGESLYPIGPTGYESRWRVELNTYNRLVEDNLVLWKKTKKQGKEIWWPYVKYYAEGRTKRPSPLWTEIEGNKKASRDLKAILENSIQFDYPKPLELIQKIISIANVHDNDIILDSFAGSGTTAHAVLSLNKKDNGNRRFILVEMMDYADSITAERVRRVIDGYGEGDKAVPGTGGSFTFYELGENLFNDDGNLNAAVLEEKIREYVWYMETKLPLPVPRREAENKLENKTESGSATQNVNEDKTERNIKKGNNAFLGIFNHTAYYFYYNATGATTLDHEFLSTVKTKAESYVIYADACALGEGFLTKHHITFKKIPRDIERL